MLVKDISTDHGETYSDIIEGSEVDLCGDFSTSWVDKYQIRECCVSSVHKTVVDDVLDMG